MLKKVEYYLKNIFDIFLRKDSKPVLIKKSDAKIRPVDGSRILLLRHDRIGDVLVSVPFVKALRQTFPKIEIDILMSSKNISARRAIDSYVNNVYNYDKNIVNIIKLVSTLRNRNYDIIIDLFDNPSTTSAYLIRLVNPLYALGFDKEDTSYYTHIVPLPDKRLIHIVERIANLLLPFGISTSKSDLNITFRLSPAEKKRANEMMLINDKKIIAINLSGSSRAKFWGVPNYISLLNELSDLHPNFECVIFSMPDYATELNDIISNTKARIAPKSNSFVQYASYLSTCDLLITPDTSAVHLAAAFKIPCVSLHLWNGSEATGMPWHAYNSPQKTLKTDSGNLSNIKVEDVINSVNELIVAS